MNIAAVTDEHRAAENRPSQLKAGRQPDLVVNCYMDRELVWLEDRTFGAWSCTTCRWILLGPPPTNKPSKVVQEAFDKHDCDRFARIIDSKAKPCDSRTA